MRRLLPSPWLSLGLFGGWLLLTRSFSIGQVLLGLGVAIAMPLLMAPSLAPARCGAGACGAADPARRSRGGALRAGAGGAFLRSRSRPPRGTFVVVPLELPGRPRLGGPGHDLGGHPGHGVVRAGARPQRPCRYTCSDLEDEAAFIQHFKTDYEQPLKGSFRMSPTLSLAITATLILYAVAMGIGMARLFRGPSAQDRVLAMDFVYVVVGMLVMLALAIRDDSEMYFEGALVMVLFGFVGSVAMAKFLLRGEAARSRPCKPWPRSALLLVGSGGWCWWPRSACGVCPTSSCACTRRRALHAGGVDRHLRLHRPLQRTWGGAVPARVLAIIIVLSITAPVTTIAWARAALFRCRRDDLPAPLKARR